MKLTLAKVLARKYQQVVLYLNLCPLCLLIAFANSWTQIRPDKMSSLLDGIEKIQHLKSKIWHNYKVYRNIKKKAIFENPKADQNTLFCKYVFFEPPRLYFSQ